MACLFLWECELLYYVNVHCCILIGRCFIVNKSNFRICAFLAILHGISTKLCETVLWFLYCLRSAIPD